MIPKFSLLEIAKFSKILFVTFVLYYVLHVLLFHCDEILNANNVSRPIASFFDTCFKVIILHESYQQCRFWTFQGRGSMIYKFAYNSCFFCFIRNKGGASDAVSPKNRRPIPPYSNNILITLL